MMRPDLLTFIIGTPVVADGNFKKSRAGSDGFGQDFRVLIPTLRCQLVAINKRSAIQQITRINVRKRGVVQNIKNKRN